MFELAEMLWQTRPKDLDDIHFVNVKNFYVILVFSNTLSIDNLSKSQRAFHVCFNDFICTLDVPWQTSSLKAEGQPSIFS